MQKFHGHIVYLTVLASELTIFVLSGHISKKKNAFLCLFLKVFGENMNHGGSNNVFLSLPECVSMCVVCSQA